MEFALNVGEIYLAIEMPICLPEGNVIDRTYLKDDNALDVVQDATPGDR
ncbi:hypothetical protein M8756_14850 [Lutimaribacter sp. EGI FJ00015]|uniref:Uncharacterized protein n=1 Tax=Lutimaribacter degradans TaxID=2945989 RepID=A0ACC5ZZ14_9RHOB|nr:hypothetical protein [Lutimaribacter sp. EGI FJ00013]MCM2563326.1 hypothetical protein [Lutimaribacter sp. EGI FJ00013]MCO0614597.1 hypothetical protein [Lutimaribacter sp. EGI FJ00015]